MASPTTTCRPLWIPVEVTKLGEGSFIEAWALGAKICKRLAADHSLKITDVRQAWSDYAYALPTYEAEINLPDAEFLKNTLRLNLDGLERWREDYVQRTYITPLLQNPKDHQRRLALAQTRIETEDYNDAISHLLPLSF
jgi:hypothetical protein